MKRISRVILFQIFTTFFMTSLVGAAILVTPANVKQSKKFSVKTNYKVGGRPAPKGGKPLSGLITFDIIAKGNAGKVMQKRAGWLELADGAGWVALMPIAARVEKGKTFYRFEVKRSLLEYSEFSFNLGKNITIALSDWRSIDNPLTPEFKIRNSCVAPGDTIFVDLTVVSSEQVSLSVDESYLGWDLNGEDRARLAQEPNYVFGMLGWLNFEPDEPQSFVFKVPARHAKSLLDGSGNSPLDPGTYFLTCEIKPYGHLGLMKEFQIEVLE